MRNQILTFFTIQIVALLLSFFVLGFALAGSHGRLYFSNAGGTVALIMTVLLSTPWLYLFLQRKKLQRRKLLFIIATLLFILVNTIIYVGFPNMTKRFIVHKNNINHLTVYNDKNEIVKPVFRPLAWDSLHSETIQMNSFFEINNFSKMHKFTLSGQYSIEHTESLKMQVDCTITKNGESISDNKEFRVRIANHLTLEKLIKY